MNTEEDKLAAENYSQEAWKNGVHHKAYFCKESGENGFLAGASHIRSTVVAPLEAKLAKYRVQTEKSISAFQHANNEFNKLSAAYAEIAQSNANAEAQLSEAQRVIKDFREVLLRRIPSS